MKILRLRFKNLNSLYGEWNIDFTDPEYISSGIFAITGPTGAGKSTILDAICLALYGATPRLGKITKDNEIMSRRTGECFSEVTFQSQQGTFICHWEQHRARKKKEGKLSEAKHEISDAITKKVLESKKRNVADAIEERTGMDFDRFTRSILLAQGGFDTFLKADADHRAPVLEQITGTEIYSEISKKIHERRRDETQKLELLKSETQGISTLSDDDRLELQNAIAQKETLDACLSQRRADTDNSIRWLSDLDSLRQDIASLNLEEKALLHELEVFKPEGCKLEMAQRAVNLDGDYASLQSLRTAQSGDIETLGAVEADLPMAGESLKEADKRLQIADKNKAEAREKQKEETLIIKKVRSLDQALLAMEETMATGELECEKLDKQIDEKTEYLKDREAELLTTRSELDQVMDYMLKNTGHELLVGQITGIEEQIKNLNSKYDDLKGIKASLKKAERELTDLTGDHVLKVTLFETSQKALEDAKSQTLKEQEELKDLLSGQLLREHRARRDFLMRELMLVKKIEQLEDEREKLEDGKPCPLCGSCKHPYAEGNLPGKGDAERDIDRLEKLIDSAEKLEKSIKDMEMVEKEKSLDLARSEIELSGSKNKVQRAEEELHRLETDLENSEGRTHGLEKSLLKRLEPLGISAIDDKNTDTILEDLKGRLHSWKESEAQKIKAQDEIKDLIGSIKGIEAVLETMGKNRQDRQASLGRAGEEHSSQLKEREKLYGSKNPDEEESRLAAKTAELENKERSERENREVAGRELERIKSRIVSLKDAITARAPALENCENVFLISLQKAGFSDETSFSSCRMGQEERAVLSEKAKKLDRAKSSLDTRKQDRGKKLREEESRAVTEASLEDLKKRDEDLKSELKEIGQKLGAMKQQLEEDVISRSRISEKQNELVNQSRECLRWDKLHSLIGSADGKLYRNFAQGITFELMVSHANRQLIKMTDRYLLTRDDKEALELNVVDNYQGGEIRSTRNLSGGESFIVSLALALGLSQMASRKVRVDSLFLDEGFGTLDEESLDMALETLASLQHDGKLIGVISHVGALKERIPTQIEIKPSQGGKSRLQGPGCTEN